jgi:hypothetical protein
MLAVSSCESLTTDSPTPTETAVQTTVVDLADSAQAFFGIWEGTYTTLEVRDQDGVVADPPVPLNTPLEMHLELHAWSEVSGDCGTVTVAGYPNGRVLELSVEGAEARLSIVNEQEGLEDSESFMTLTLEGDTLSGEDESEPDPPPGWYGTRGTVHLTRTAAAAAGDTEPGPGGSSAELTEEGITEPMVLEAEMLNPTEQEPTYWEWDNGDTFEEKSVRQGDHIRIRLTVDVASECQAVTWEVSGDTGVLLSQGMALHKTGPFIDTVVKNYEVIGTGRVWIRGLGNTDQPGEVLTLFRGGAVTAAE